MKEKEGLMDPKESKAAMTGEVLPWREPKSCEKPPIPMLSSLVEGHERRWADETEESHVT